MPRRKAVLNGSRARGPQRPPKATISAPAGRVYAGLSASERRDDRKARLLEAGLEYFGTIGFGKTTIPMLCSAAGVTARNFYDDFDSREALLKALYDEIAQNVFDLF